jgi:hypothetical protein
VGEYHQIGIIASYLFIIAQMFLFRAFLWESGNILRLLIKETRLSGKPPDTGSGKPPDTGSGKPPDTGSGKPPDTGSGKLPDLDREKHSLQAQENRSVPDDNGYQEENSAKGRK